MLKIENISKSFGDKQVLDQISVDVHQGEFISIIGPSGSGKSTIFSLIGGLLLPDQGDLYMNDQLITGTSGHISYMPQQSALFPWRTVLHNVLLCSEEHTSELQSHGISLLRLLMNTYKFIYI